MDKNAYLLKAVKERVTIARGAQHYVAPAGLFPYLGMEHPEETIALASAAQSIGNRWLNGYLAIFEDVSVWLEDTAISSRDKFAIIRIALTHIVAEDDCRDPARSLGVLHAKEIVEIWMKSLEEDNGKKPGCSAV